MKLRTLQIVAVTLACLLISVSTQGSQGYLRTRGQEGQALECIAPERWNWRGQPRLQLEQYGPTGYNPGNR